MNPLPARLLRYLLIPAFVLVWTGCSSFHRDWNGALTRPSPAQTMEGPWAGEWRSDATGHHGRLRCLVSRGTNASWQARFHATYKALKILPLTFGYTVSLTVDQTQDRFVFHGEEDLGKLAGGLYRYEGEATAETFFSTYQCQYDHGTFQMTRPDQTTSD